MINTGPTTAEAEAYPYYEIYLMQVYLAKDGWSKKFVEISPGTGIPYMKSLIDKSGRDIELLRYSEESALDGASVTPSGGVNFVFLNCDPTYERSLEIISAWWPKIRVSGWMGGCDMRFAGTRKAVEELFRTQYPQPDPMLRVVNVGFGWLVPKFHEPINFPWKGAAYFG